MQKPSLHDTPPVHESCFCLLEFQFAPEGVDLALIVGAWPRPRQARERPQNTYGYFQDKSPPGLAGVDLIGKHGSFAPAFNPHMRVPSRQL